MIGDSKSLGAYVFGRFRLDPVRMILSCDGEPIVLRPTVFQLLLHFVENPQRLIEKDEFLTVVWDGRFVEEANLSQTIFWLRAALKDHDNTDGAAMIATVRGKGYRFTAPVIWKPEIAQTTSGVDGLPLPVGPVGRRRFGWRGLAVLGACVVVIASLGLGGGLAWRRTMRTSAHGNTVVLADFQNQTADPVFDRSLASVLRIDLGQSPFVTVTPDKDARDVLAMMTRPQDSVITTPIADEICTRRNADAVLTGSVYGLGKRYVLTLIATDCSGRQTLAAEKANVATREDVITSLDHLIGKVRTRLGEPVASVDRFNVPLMPERTFSLDALRAFSEGVWLGDRGRQLEAETLFKQAISLDPNFADAYVNLGISYAGLFQPDLAKQALEKAYPLRDNLNERERFRVTTLYDRHVTHDFNETISTLQAWTAIYPNDVKAWGNLADAETVLGRYDASLAAADRMMALGTKFESAFDILARAQQRLGRPTDTRATAQRAIDLGFGGGATHELLLEAAFMQHDAAAVQQEITWSDHNANTPFLFEIQGEMAYGKGRITEGAVPFDRGDEIADRQGVDRIGTAYRARLLVDLGLPDQAEPLLKRKNSSEDVDYLFTSAEVGDPHRVEVLLNALLQKYPSGTLTKFFYVPEVRAALALRKGKPAEAISALQPALPYQSRNFDVPYILGRAYLAVGNGPAARAAFETILTHQGWYPASPLYSLAELGLARALVLSHDAAGARRAYQTFLAAWAHADADLPVLKAAKSEYARVG